MWNRSENQIQLILIRHGETASNKEHRYLGKTDEALSRAGIEALKQAKKEQKYLDVQEIFTSPMKRCTMTADILYPDQKAQVIAAWEEMDFGDFEGKNYQDLQDDERYQKWIDSNGTLPFPNGESREAFQKRCKQGFLEMYDRKDKESKSVALIVHGGTIMSLLSTFGGGAYFDYLTGNGQGYLALLEKREENFQITAIRKLEGE